MRHKSCHSSFLGAKTCAKAVKYKHGFAYACARKGKTIFLFKLLYKYGNYTLYYRYSWISNYLFDL